MRRIMMTIGCGLVLCGTSFLSAQEKQVQVPPPPEAKPVQAPAQKPVQAPAQKVEPVQAPTQKLEPVQKGDAQQKVAMQKPAQKPTQSPVQKVAHGHRRGRH